MSRHEKAYRVTGSQLLGRTMLVRDIGHFENRESETLVLARLDTGEEVAFPPGVVVKAQLDERPKQAPYMPCWAKLVAIDGASHRYHKFIWADLVGWGRCAAAGPDEATRVERTAAP
jgi:hypothetical protein